MKITTRGVGLLSFLLFISNAQAALIQLTSPAGLQASDTTLVYPDADGSSYSGSVSYSAGGNQLTISTGQTLTRYVVGTDYSVTAFANGTPILSSGYVFANNPGGTLSFSSGVSELGFTFEDANYGDYTAAFTAYDGTRALGTYTANGNDYLSLAFIGVAATGGDLITRLDLSDNAGNAFTFGPISFATGTAGNGGSPAQVPEPASLILAMLGLGFMTLRITRRGEGTPLGG